MNRSVFSFVAGLVLGVFSFACGHGLQVETAKSKMYGDDITICRAYSETCADMVICQHNAQRQYGYPMTGTCKGQALTDYVEDTDAGPDASSDSSAGGQ